MLDPVKAAEWLVIAWCKDWKLMRLLDVVADDASFGDVIGKGNAAHKAFPWMPAQPSAYFAGVSVRQFVGGAYPKLSAWLFARKDDVSRLRCVEQIAKLRDPGACGSRRAVSLEDRAEMRGSSRDYRRSMASGRLLSDSAKTHNRSAWNVCKA